MHYFVYILYSASADQFYKGACRDMKDRLKRHNAGLEKSTKHGTPWTLIWVTEKDRWPNALKLERKLKNLSRLSLVAFMEKYVDCNPL